MNTTGQRTIPVQAAESRPRRQFVTGNLNPTDTAAVPATFQAAPDAPCEAHAWCVETGTHADHFGRRVSLPTVGGRPPILTAHFYTDEPAGLPELDFNPGSDDWREYTTGDELRGQTAKVRAHLIRLDALADEYDAIREAGTDRPQTGTAPADGFAGVLQRTAAYVAEHGVTTEQAEALANVVRASKGVGYPDYVSRELANTLTARVRGPEWMTAYGCTPLCVMDHAGADGEPGWHRGAAAELAAPGRLSLDLPGEKTEPLFVARVVTVNDTPDVFGIHSKLWVDLTGDTMELSLSEVDTFIGGLEGFLPRLRALRAQLAEVCEGDIPGNEDAEARWHAEWQARAAAERAEIERQANGQDGAR